MGFHERLARFGSAARAFDETVGPKQGVAARAAASAALRDAAVIGARLILVTDDTYPAALRDLRDPPPVLFALGADETLAAPVVAIVGTRLATSYGERVTRELAGALARAGACVVSGMARGIDATAHRAALDAGGRTAAVLGTGVDVAYPAAHRPLHRDIASHGLLLSEWVPGARANAGSFPRRNRVIAALASVTIVVEAGTRSGALITAEHALELGRTVAAVPGAIDALTSAGTNALLRDGAQLIASAADALALAGLTAPLVRPVAGTLSGDECVVWEALAGGAPDIDTLASRTRLPAARCLAAVTTLELAGTIECALTGEILRRLS